MTYFALTFVLSKRNLANEWNSAWQDVVNFYSIEKMSEPKNREGFRELGGDLVHRTLELRLGHDPDERPEEVLRVFRIRPVGEPKFDHLVNLPNNIFIIYYCQTWGRGGGLVISTGSRGHGFDSCFLQSFQRNCLLKVYLVSPNWETNLIQMKMHLT